VIKSVLAGLPFFRPYLEPAVGSLYPVSAEVVAVIRNAGWLLLDKCCRVLFGLLVGAWVARYLGPASFGELAYVLVYLGMFQVIASMGTDAIAVRELSANRASAATVLGSAFALKLVAGVACLTTAVLGMAISAGIDDKRTFLCMLAGGSVVFQSADTVDLWFQSQSQSRLTVLAKMIAYVAANGLKIILILYQAPLMAFAAMQAFESCLAAVSLYLVYCTQRGPVRWTVSGSQLRLFLSEGWTFVLSGISIAIYSRVDQ
jgi:O-antigen/teichoic acid export membrane protein